MSFGDWHSYITIRLFLPVTNLREKGKTFSKRGHRQWYSQIFNNLHLPFHWWKKYIWGTFLKYVTSQLFHLFKGPLPIRLVICIIVGCWTCRTVVSHVPLKWKLLGVSCENRAVELWHPKREAFNSRRAFYSSYPCVQRFLKISGSKWKRSILCPVYLISRIFVSLIY